jgi:hypothetical protein
MRHSTAAHTRRLRQLSTAWIGSMICPGIRRRGAWRTLRNKTANLSLNQHRRLNARFGAGSSRPTSPGRTSTERSGTRRAPPFRSSGGTTAPRPGTRRAGSEQGHQAELRQTKQQSEQEVQQPAGALQPPEHVAQPSPPARSNPFSPAFLLRLAGIGMIAAALVILGTRIYRRSTDH